MAELDDMEARVRAALEGSVDECARCKTCDAQVNAVMAVIEDEAVNRMAEQFVAESRIRALEVRDGKICLDAHPAREIVAMWIGSARTMIGDAVNYIEMDVQLADTGEGYTFHLSRRGKLTPHQARKRAEDERDDARAAVQEICNRLRDEGYLALLDQVPGWLERAGVDREALEAGHDQ